MNRFLVAIKPYIGERTLATTRRGLNAVGDAFENLKNEGRVKTTNPAKMNACDVEALLEYMKTARTRSGIGLKLATQANYLNYFGKLLRWIGNPVIDKMKDMQHVRFPKKVITEVRVLPEPTVCRILSSLETMPGWEGCVARFMVAMYAYSGLRRSELRRARLEDLNIVDWRILVAHPKGEKSWASPATAPVLQPARKAVLEFLKEREDYLRHCGIGSAEPLVPYVSRAGKAGYWTDGMWGKVKASAVGYSGTPFRIQELRATFGQMCIDRGGSIEHVSRALRHDSTTTTERYYARVKPEQAFKGLEALFPEFEAARRD